MTPTLLNRLLCPHCSKMFVSQRGRTAHIHTVHSNQRKCPPPRAHSDSNLGGSSTSAGLDGLQHPPEHDSSCFPNAHTAFPGDFADHGGGNQSPEDSDPHSYHTLQAGKTAQWQKEYHPYLSGTCSAVEKQSCLMMIPSATL